MPSDPIPAPRQSMGTIRYPRGHTLPQGTPLTMNFLRFVSQDAGNVVAIRNWDVFRGTLCSFNFARGGQLRSTGSGVMVGPGIILGARHVIQPEADNMVSGEIEGLITAITSHGIMLWHPIHIVADPSSDIAIISATCASDLPPGNILPVAAMSSQIPRLGERITIAGFRPSHDNFQTNSEGSTVSGEIYVSTGPVTQIFENGRDRFLLPWPIIEVECATLGAMSGGPAFNEAGQLIGVLATSIDSNEGRGPSYVSLLRPALPLLFQPAWPVRTTQRICLEQRIRHLWQLD